ncbi:trypsin-like peptidase domain-containing protein [Lyngbya confervoides]|uniref:Trypsin-like peptidase domain-containing protein n=1 Tax=Lyngbya confervoides BDU141951 TaxID=1574623 RepID=A0ABD4T8C1_9CYAN|nr:trypsin-like peptidase domain-containing protein [Lyngbya confervoides]MCM1984832.1 trypsin-like peptidase domain-containing protein [Lyngbya confervoides BDU141951]
MASAWLGAIALSRRARALSGREIRDRAAAITVQIQAAGSSGSGVLLQRQGNRYAVLTAKHVVDATQPGEELYAVTSDGRFHGGVVQEMVLLAGLDVALLWFAVAPEAPDYALAVVGNSDALVETDRIYVAGFPQTGLAITRPTFTITQGVVTGKGTYERGYGLIDDNVTQTGMSGGPILNQQGQLVGIHGLAEQVVQGVPVKAGLSLGIPIQTAIAVLPIAVPVLSPEDPPAPADTFDQFLDRYYAALPRLLEKRDALSLYSFMPIHKERFRYRTRTGKVQDYNARLVGATEFYQRSLARGESWTILFDEISIHRPDPNRALVTHRETVKWSLWPGLLRGVSRRQETYEWERFDHQWMIVSGSERVLDD